MLGLWTAAWLAVLLLGGLLWLGDLSLQWPVLLVPVLWALVALRPRRSSDRGRSAARWRSTCRRRCRTDTVERPVVSEPADPAPWTRTEPLATGGVTGTTGTPSGDTPAPDRGRGHESVTWRA